MEIKITLLDKIAVVLFYMFVACGVISILINVLIEHGYVLASALAFAFIWLWIRARDIINIKRGKKFHEKHEMYCKSCKYKQENDK